MTTPSKNATQKVLVVGAGPSGLAALKEMREVGLEAVAVDARSQIGGVFSPNSNVTFEGLYLTTSNMFMAFSDFPPKDKHMCYWTKEQYYDYLVDYAKQFKLMDHIRLDTKVQKAKLDEESKKWQVSIAGKPEVFDYLIVATGANHKPKIPDIFKGFTGKVMHSSEYHSAEQVKGQRVLVVGTGESATDVSHSASKVASHVTIWGRQYPDMAPRFITDLVNDKDFNELKHLQQQDKLIPGDMLESITTSRMARNLPLAAWSGSIHALMYDVKNQYGPDSPHRVLCDIDTSAWSLDRISSDTALVTTKSMIMGTCASKGELDFMIAPSMTCEAGTKKMTFHKPKYHKKDFTKEGTESIDVEVDVVVACTGYGTMQLDHWLETPEAIVPNPRMWFKHCFPPNMEEHIAFLGYARPHSGGIPQCSEILARYIAQLRVKNLEFPKNMEQMTKMDGDGEEECFHRATHNLLLVDYHAFMISVARLIGCTPRMPWAPSQIVKHWSFPLWPCFLRTQGPGVNVAACDAVLNKFGTYDALAPMPFLAIELFFTFLMPFINAFSWFLDPLLDLGKKGSLSRLYRWRMSKFHFMYSHLKDLDKEDFKFVFGQLVAGVLILTHMIKMAVVKLSRSAVDKISPVKMKVKVV